jgi:hypothetical protein
LIGNFEDRGDILELIESTADKDEDSFIALFQNVHIQGDDELKEFVLIIAIPLCFYDHKRNSRSIEINISCISNHLVATNFDPTQGTSTAFV